MRISILLGVALAQSVSQVEVYQQAMAVTEKFGEFVEKYGRDYKDTDEMLRRLQIFAENMKKAGKQAQQNGGATYGHMSPFADWTREEFKAYNTYKPSLLRTSPTVELSTAGNPSSFDWRPKGAVNGVKDQAQCGSCWAFSTVCNIEGARVVQTGQSLLSLSEQELVECSDSDNGCNGGLQPRAYDDMINGHWGLELESDYPYTSQSGDVGSCSKKSGSEKVFIDSWTQIGTSDEQIKAALIKYGPLAIALNASPMQMYMGGIDDPEDCSPDEIDHAVAIVGYGSEGGQDYWIIRNSWGTGWGEDGYYRLVRGKNACGMNSMVFTALFNSQADIQV